MRGDRAEDGEGMSEEHCLVVETRRGDSVAAYIIEPVRRRHEEAEGVEEGKIAGIPVDTRDFDFHRP